MLIKSKIMMIIVCSYKMSHTRVFIFIKDIKYLTREVVMFKIANLFKDKGLVFISDEKILSKLEKYLCFKEVKLDNFCLKANGTKESVFSDINNFTISGKTDYQGDLLQDLGLIRQE